MNRKGTMLAALAGLCLLAVVPLLTASRTAYNPVGTQGATDPTITVIFKLAPAGIKSWQGRAHEAWDDYAAIADTIYNLTRQQIASDWVANKDYGDTDNVTNQIKPGNMVDSLTHQRYVDISTCGQINGAYNKMPCNYSHAAGITYQRYGLLYMPFEDYLPADVQIVSAKIMAVTDLATVSTISSGARADTLVAVLDTVAADSMWYRGPLTATGASSYFRCQRAASWNNQIQPAGKGYATTGRNYPAAASQDSFPWTPSLASRSRSIDWGPRGVGFVPAADVGADSSVAIDITRPMQYIVNGARNNGFFIQWWTNNPTYGSSNATVMRLHTWNADSTSADSLSIPWVVVQYRARTDGNLGPYPGGKEVMFTFCTDDGRDASNDAYADIFQQRGLSYTAFVNRTHLDDTGYYTGADLVRWLGQGVEIGNHGKTHATNGLRKYTMTAAGYDSLVNVIGDMDPGWIDSLMAAEGVQDSAYYAAHRYVGKTYALAQNRWNLNAVAVAESLGYVGVRSSVLGSHETVGDTLGCYLDGTAANGWLRGYGLRMPAKHHFLMAPYIWSDYELYTSTGAASGPKESDSTQVKRRIRLAIEDRAVRGLNGYWILFTHATFAQQGAYTGAIDADQLRWTLNAMNEAGNVYIVNFGDGMRYLRRNGQEFDHPAYGTAGWQSRLADPRQVWWKGRTWK